MSNLKWEPVEERTLNSMGGVMSESMFRARTPWGWLCKGVRHTPQGESLALTFIFDPLHRWKLAAGQ